MNLQKEIHSLGVAQLQRLRKHPPCNMEFPLLRKIPLHLGPLIYWVLDSASDPHEAPKWVLWLDSSWLWRLCSVRGKIWCRIYFVTRVAGYQTECRLSDLGLPASLGITNLP